MARSKVKRTNHTVLVRVRNEKTARVVKAHHAITSKYTLITSPYFAHPEYASGDLLIVRIKLSGKRRLVQWVNKDMEVRNVEDFDRVYGEMRADEEKTYDWIHDTGKEFTPGAVITGAGAFDTAATIIDPDPEPEPVIEVEEPIDWGSRIYIGEQDEKLLNTIEKLSNKRHVAIMMIGPSGYGKTSIPEQKAIDWNMEFLRWDCATVRDPEEFFGFRGAVDGSTMTGEGETFFSESNFTKVLEEGNAVIVLDELNRIDPYISNILFPLLDHAGKTSVAGHDIKVGPNVIFFATVNLGFQFTGTFTLDTALTNRFTAKILVNALPTDIEEKVLVARAGVRAIEARKIVRLMSGLRRLNEKGQLSADASTRVSIQIAELMGCGLDIKTALVYVVINGISGEEAKLVIDQLGMGF